MSESPWYDRLLVVLPESYRAGVFILSIVALGIFFYVRLNYGFDWDTALASYYFGLPCSLALMASGIIFLPRSPENPAFSERGELTTKGPSEFALTRLVLSSSLDSPEAGSLAPPWMSISRVGKMISV